MENTPVPGCITLEIENRIVTVLEIDLRKENELVQVLATQARREYPGRIPKIKVYRLVSGLN